MTFCLAFPIRKSNRSKGWFKLFEEWRTKTTIIQHVKEYLLPLLFLHQLHNWYSLVLMTILQILVTGRKKSQKKNYIWILWMEIMKSWFSQLTQIFFMKYISNLVVTELRKISNTVKKFVIRRIEEDEVDFRRN